MYVGMVGDTALDRSEVDSDQPNPDHAPKFTFFPKMSPKRRGFPSKDSRIGDRSGASDAGTACAAHWLLLPLPLPMPVAVVARSPPPRASAALSFFFFFTDE